MGRYEWVEDGPTEADTSSHGCKYCHHGCHNCEPDDDDTEVDEIEEWSKRSGWTE